VKVWARYAVPVMVLVDEDSDEIERVVLVAGEREHRPGAPEHGDALLHRGS
jgi:hypothetical protein